MSQGKIVQIIGAVVDVEFAREEVPKTYDALKVREAAHLFTEGLSVEQLRHGPGFALGSRDALVSLDGGGPSAARLREVADAVEAAGSRVYRIAATEFGVVRN